MTLIAACPISTCDWKLEEDDELNARNIAVSPQVAAALGTPLDAFLSIREHQLRRRYERDLEEHFKSHPVLDWVTDLQNARMGNALSPANVSRETSPALASSIEVDWDAQKVTVEGRDLPWFLSPKGPRVEPVLEDDDFGVVWLPVLAESITVTGEAPPANVSRETSHAHAVAWVDPLLLVLGQYVLAYAEPMLPGDGPVAEGTFVHVITEGGLDRDATVVLDDAGDAQRLLIRGHHFALGTRAQERK